MYKHLNVSIMLLALICVISLALTACSSSQQEVIPREMIGTWVGFGHHTLAAEFLDQKQIPFMLIITDKGNISGYVGEAVIKKTQIVKTAWWLRLIGKEEFKAVVELSGNIVNQESFTRDGGTIVFEKISSDELLCGFNSTGSQVDSKNMALPVREIKLNHPD